MGDKERSKIIFHTSIISILVNIMLATMKAIVGLFVKSIAVVLDAINNLSDAISSVVTIIGTKLAGKKPDKKHPLGYGRIEYLTAMIVSAIILYAGITALIQSIKKAINPDLADYSVVSLVLISVAVVVKIFLGLFVIKRGKKAKSDALTASGKDALFDAILSFSVLVCAIITLTTNFSLEAYVGIIISLFIIKAAIEMMVETVNDILGKRVETELSKEIKAVICEEENVLGAYDLIVNNYGPNRSIGSIHIEVDGNMKASDIHILTRNISMKIYEEFGMIMTVGIYSSNPTNSAIRKFIHSMVMDNKEIREVHGLYVDEELKIISFDLIIDFKCKNQDELINQIKERIEKEFPDYKCNIVQDFDFSD